MATEIDAQNVEYVEYLDGEEYDEDQEVVTIDEDGVQQVEYIEAQQVPDGIEYDGDGVPHVEGHTIFEHNGRQYMIPNELHQSGQTIVLEDYAADEAPATEEEQYILPNEENEIEVHNSLKNEEESEITYSYDDPNSTSSPSECYMIYAGEQDEEDEEDEDEAQDDDAEELHPASSGVRAGGPQLGRQYAVLRDGKLHIEGGPANETPGEDLEDKLQVLEDSLTYQEDEAVEITGKNLITGQTISLNGFLEKLKKKSDLLSVKRHSPDSSFYPPNVKKQRQSYYNQSKSERGKPNPADSPKPNYVLMPPVNRKFLVGKTAQGKNIVGKILQIWKKIDPSSPVPKPRTVRRKPQPRTVKPDAKQQKDIEELIIDNTGKILHVQKIEENPVPKNIVLKKKYVSKAFLDQNIVKTLSGLMELASVQKNLAEKNLIIKHILKKSIEGKIVPGKEITYYYGHMEKSDVVDCFNEVKTQWTFISDYRKSTDKKTGIDLSESSDTQQVDLAADEKVNFGALTEPILTDLVSAQSDTAEAKIKKSHEFTETVPVNLIVIEDEYGKKRTKVTIPQLGGSPKCQICHKMFRSDLHLKRHLSQHATSKNMMCETCGEAFHDTNSLFRHCKTHSHEAEGKEYVCYVCGKIFTSPGSLKRHITVHDHSLRPLQCMTCMQRFTDESSLKRHMILHTGIKPFQCETCLKCFVHQGDLNFHKKIHDPVKRYQCCVCGKEFNRHSNMLRHADIHRAADDQKQQPAYRCDVCGCQYNFISSLTRHIVNKHMNQGEEAASELIVETCDGLETHDNANRES